MPHPDRAVTWEEMRAILITLPEFVALKNADLKIGATAWIAFANYFNRLLPKRLSECNPDQLEILKAVKPDIRFTPYRGVITPFQAIGWKAGDSQILP